MKKEKTKDYSSTLWKTFKETGSVNDYLDFIRESRKKKEFEKNRKK